MDFNFDCDFLKQLILLGIPIGVGIYTSKKLTNSYQKNKEKSDLRRRVLSEFTASYTKKYTMIKIFYSLIHEQYHVATIEQGMVKQNKNLPDDPDDIPSKKYSDKRNDFAEEFADISFSSNVFWRSLGFYYADVELSAKVKELSAELYDAYSLTKLFFESSQPSEFFQRYDQLEAKMNSLNELFHYVEDKLHTAEVKI